MKTKKSIVIYFCILFLGCNLISPWKWGHHFEFTNELNIEIDSLQITIGDKENTILSFENEISANLDVPKSGYPHIVYIHIYFGNKIKHIEADSFNNYNADGTHEYILRDDSALYRFHN